MVGPPCTGPLPRLATPLRGPDIAGVCTALPPAKRLYEGVLNAPLGCRGCCSDAEAMARIVLAVVACFLQGGPDAVHEPGPGEKRSILPAKQRSGFATPRDHVLQHGCYRAQRATRDPDVQRNPLPEGVRLRSLYCDAECCRGHPVVHGNVREAKVSVRVEGGLRGTRGFPRS